MVNRIFIPVILGSLLPILSALADTTPGDAYREIFKKEQSAKSYEDLCSFRSKASIAADKPMSDEEKKLTLSLFKAVLPHEVTVIGEQTKGDKATLKVKAAPDKDLKPGSEETTIGTVEMTWEDGQWKLDKESWESHVEVH